MSSRLLTLVSVLGMFPGSGEIEFHTADGRVFRMFHYQDCCEDVRVEDVVGDAEDLLNSPILRAEARSQDASSPEDYESATWTFYELVTNRGSVTLRWLGESNGCYSEEVDFKEDTVAR